MIAVAGLDDILDQTHLTDELETGFTVRRAAEILERDPHVHTGPHRLFEQLRELHWIVRDETTDRWVPSVVALAGEWLTSNRIFVRTSLAERALVPQVLVTIEGLAELRELLREPDEPQPEALFD